MKPLAPAWRRIARWYRSGGSHLGADAPVVVWRGRVIAPYAAHPGATEIASIFDRAGEVVRTIPAPAPAPRMAIREPVGPAVLWPEEELVLGVYVEDRERRFDLMWIDLDDAAECTAVTFAQDIERRSRVSIEATPDGAVLVSAGVRDMSMIQHPDWPLPAALNVFYSTIMRWPCEDDTRITRCVRRRGAAWEVAGRVACVADDVVVLEEDAQIAKQIVGRRTSDGTELWRIAAADCFVLGSIPMPAWSDDRVYVLDRAARRRQAWAREAAAARANNLVGGNPFQAAAATRYLARFRDGEPLTTATALRCLSARTGAELWRVDVAGDIVSFRAHPRWIAIVAAGRRAGALRTFRHDGTPIAEVGVDEWIDGAESSLWPPDPTRWPCIAWGDDEHLVVAHNRPRRDGAALLYAVPIDRPAEPRWDMPLPAPCVSGPRFSSLRLVNHVPMAFLPDAAVLRWGKHLHGFVA